MKKLLIATLLANAVAVPVSAAELVANGGFEHPAGLNSGWNYVVSNTLSVLPSPSAAHSGDHALQFTATTQIYDDYLYESLDTVAGETYTYSFWVASQTNDQQAPSLFFASIGGLTIGYFPGLGDFDYTHVTGSYVAISDSTDLYFEGFNSQGYFLLDDVSVTGPLAGDCGLRVAGCIVGTDGGGVPEPASWALMITGFAGVGAMMRRRPRALVA